MKAPNKLTIDIDDVTVLLGLAREVLVNGPACQVLAVVLRQWNEPDFCRRKHRLTVVVNTHVIVTGKN